MAGMRIVVRAGLIAACLALLAPAGAQAGTYDVVSCNAPGANGRNNSLEYAPDSYDPQYNAQVGGWYEAGRELRRRPRRPLAHRRRHASRSGSPAGPGTSTRRPAPRSSG